MVFLLLDMSILGWSSPMLRRSFCWSWGTSQTRSFSSFTSTIVCKFHAHFVHSCLLFSFRPFWSIILLLTSILRLWRWKKHSSPLWKMQSQQRHCAGNDHDTHQADSSLIGIVGVEEEQKLCYHGSHISPCSCHSRHYAQWPAIMFTTCTKFVLVFSNNTFRWNAQAEKSDRMLMY